MLLAAQERSRKVTVKVRFRPFEILGQPFVMGNIFAGSAAEAPAMNRADPAPAATKAAAAPARPAERFGAALAGKKRKAPRLPANCDDDEAVERYLARVTTYEEAVLDDALRVHNDGVDDATVAAELRGVVEKIVRNLAAGDCVRKIASAAVFVVDPSKLRGARAVGVLLFQDASPRARGNPESADARLLAAIGDEICGEADLIGQFHGSGPAMDACVPALVAATIGEGLATADDRGRLERRWAAWLRGVPWAKATMTAVNRPSLASWVGFPWEGSHVCEHQSCGLLAGVEAHEAAAVRTHLQWEKSRDEIAVPDEVKATIIPLWSAGETPTPADVRASFDRALRAARALKNEPKTVKKARKA